MTKAIQQSAHFAAPPEELFEMYLDSKKHSEATGGIARTQSRRQVYGLARSAGRPKHLDRAKKIHRANVAGHSLAAI